MQSNISSVPAQYVKQYKEKYGEFFKLNKRDCIFVADVKNAISSGRTNISESIAEKIAICAAWDKNRAIYIFNKKLSDELYQRTGSIDEIPCSVLYGMPYDCLYVHLGKTSLYGYFVSKHRVSSDNPDIKPNIKSELLILPINSSIYAKYALKIPIIENVTFGEAKAQTAQDGLMKLKSFGLRTRSDIENYIIKEYESNLSKIINQILYICCENADIKKKRTEPRIWEVGFSVGEKIEASRQTGTGKKLRYAKRGCFNAKLSYPSDYPLLFWFPPVFMDK